MQNHTQDPCRGLHNQTALLLNRSPIVRSCHSNHLRLEALTPIYHLVGSTALSYQCQSPTLQALQIVYNGMSVSFLTVHFS